ncbi:hypothetical protein H257_18939 [Aphanomyces astaci]|uniref:HTH CENPB-type domain-containing protein n=1 Tax=Aphanomyces astaci TaxID=112090 RepID=W4F9J7_APHAT|nr:hypothetical protein H257_18939 [Aphanomyces astaci]ETV64127.1 hypothetical protein H257_18939 [Aphanomyces astaci]|eukprot:XP_009846388.1 hypothetical protein H257_18939 [Aphanomyces astaci]
MAPTRPAPHRLASGRPRVKNTPRKGPAKHQRVFTTYAKKLHVLQWLENNTIESTLDTFLKGVSGVARQTAWKKILHWRSQIDFITQAASSPSSASNRTIRSTGTGTTLDSAAEENIANWVCQLRSDGVPVSRLLLSCKALEVAKDLGLSTAQFKASPSWVDDFFRTSSDLRFRHRNAFSTAKPRAMSLQVEFNPSSKNTRSKTFTTLIKLG